MTARPPRVPSARDPRPGDPTSRAGAAARTHEPPQLYRERRAPSDDGMLLVGLVGRAGSGKSTVARVFAEAGAQIVEADRIGHEITDHDPDVRDALVSDYGPGVYRDDGTLDRATVAARVFSDPEARERLNRLVHPRIVRRMRGRIAEMAASGFRGPVVFDAALLLDWHFERGCDALVAVIAPDDMQVERLVRSRGWTADEARARLAAQRPNAFFAAVADVVIENDGTESDLIDAARRAFASLREGRA